MGKIPLRIFSVSHSPYLARRDVLDLASAVDACGSLTGVNVAPLYDMDTSFVLQQLSCRKTIIKNLRLWPRMPSNRRRIVVASVINPDVQKVPFCRIIFSQLSLPSFLFVFMRKEFYPGGKIYQALDLRQESQERLRKAKAHDGRASGLTR